MNDLDNHNDHARTIPGRPPATPADPRQTPRHEPMAFAWLQPLGLVGLSVYNFMMRILTLGVHHFWGKTEVRKRIWSSVRINGEPLAYTGTGRELFIGFLVVFALIVIPTMLASFGAVAVLGVDSTGFKVYQAAVYAGFLLLTGIAIYRAQRYRMNRTRWRGIRAGIEGSSLAYGWTHFWTLIVTFLTLGWFAPWRSTRLQQIITNDMRFGDRAFRFSGTSGPLYKSYAVFWFANLVLIGGIVGYIGTQMAHIFIGLQAQGQTPGDLPPAQAAHVVAAIYGGLFLAGLVYMVMSAWYRAAMIRHFARFTHLDGLTFQSTVTGRGLLWISFTNYLLLFAGALLATLALAGIGAIALSGLARIGIDPIGLTSGEPMASVFGRAATIATFLFLFALGMLLPVTQARSSGYLVRNLSLEGNIDLAAVAAGANTEITRGEGLAQAFDIDAL